MTVKTANEIREMTEACRIAAEALQYTGKFVRPGITTEELDKIADDFIRTRGAISACVGYHGYPKAICTSINDVICHGLPDKTVLQEGDIVNIDVTALKNGFHGDTSSMFFVGQISEQARKLSECAQAAMMKGIQEVRAGAFTGDIGFAIEKFTRLKGYHVVKEVGGHGIGRLFHEPPFVPSYGKKGKGTLLQKWGTITVEPMINETSAPVEQFPIKNSDITIFKTSDGSLSAQYEHTVLITDTGSEVLTLLS